MDIEIEEENYRDYLYQKYNDRERERTKEKEEIDKPPIRENHLKSALNSEEVAERQKFKKMTEEQSYFARLNKY